MLPNYSFFERLYMEELSDFLKQCILFKDMNYVDIDNFLKVSNFTIKKYLKGNLVVLEDSTCEELGILRKGLLEVQSLYPSGKSLTLNRLESAEIFGEIILFSKSNKFPSTIKAIEDSEIMFIKKANLMNCLSNCIFTPFGSSTYINLIEGFG